MYVYSCAGDYADEDDDEEIFFDVEFDDLAEETTDGDDTDDELDAMDDDTDGDDTVKKSNEKDKNDKKKTKKSVPLKKLGSLLEQTKKQLAKIQRKQKYLDTENVKQKLASWNKLLVTSYGILIDEQNRREKLHTIKIFLIELKKIESFRKHFKMHIHKEEINFMGFIGVFLMFNVLFMVYDFLWLFYYVFIISDEKWQQLIDRKPRVFVWTNSLLTIGQCIHSQY